MSLNKKKNLNFLLFFLIFLSAKNLLFCSNDQKDINCPKGFQLNLPKNIAKPKSISELQTIVQKAVNKNLKLSISGAGMSQGGQTLAQNALCIDTMHLNQILNLDVKEKKVIVEPGVTWAQLQKIIDNYGLAVQSMQSYGDFSIGGSLSVNAHGQDINYTVVDTVESIKLLLADGSIIRASKTENIELFKAALGGYGLFGIIIEITLNLIDNCMLEKKVDVLRTKDYFKYFFDKIKNEAVLHSTRLEIAPKKLFKKTISIAYYKTDKKISKRKKKQNAKLDIKLSSIFINLLRKFETAKNIRLFIEKHFIEKPIVVSRNDAMNFTIKSLTSIFKDRFDILQEYFVPCQELYYFLKHVKKIIKNHNINLVNATIRYVAKSDNVYLTYAPRDMFAVVLYINVPNTHKYYHQAKHWTRLLVDLAINHGGTYYLPYHLFATGEQLRKAYPNFDKILDLKKTYDPKETFVNSLYYLYKN